MTGEDRWMLYNVASQSGFRRNELGSLTAASFNFETSVVSLAATSDKAGTARRQDLNPVLAEAVQAWILHHGYDDGRCLWPITGVDTAEMLRDDLAAAGVAYEQDGRKADFHSLRGQFGSSMLDEGVPLPVVQRLMRHSTPELTANVYYHPKCSTLADAVAKLPVPTPPFAWAAGGEKLAAGEGDREGT